MNYKTTNTLINVGLFVLIAGLVALVAITFIDWRQSMPSSPNMGLSPTLVKQLRSTMGDDKYNNFADNFTEVTGQSPEYSAIRGDSYTATDSEITFLADSRLNPATYKVSVDKDSGSVTIECPASGESQDSSWGCNVSHSGDDH